MCFVVPCMLWSWMWMRCVGATVVVDAACVSQLWSSYPVYCGGGCGTWGCGYGLCTCGMGPWLPLMCCVCHGCSLHALCVVVVGVVGGVAIAVFAPCVLWWWVRHVGSPSQSLCCVCCGCGCGALGCGCGLHVGGVGPRSPSMCCVCCGCSLCAMCVMVVGVVCGVTVFVPYVSWLQVRRIQSQLQVPSLCHVHCGCHLCTACGVAVALFAPHVVLLVPSLRRVWCCSCGHHAVRGVCGCKRGSDGAARRDTATWNMQLGRA